VEVDKPKLAERVVTGVTDTEAALPEAVADSEADAAEADDPEAPGAAAEEAAEAAEEAALPLRVDEPEARDDDSPDPDPEELEDGALEEAELVRVTATVLVLETVLVVVELQRPLRTVAAEVWSAAEQPERAAQSIEASTKPELQRHDRWMGCKEHRAAWAAVCTQDDAHDGTPPIL
jgi:hypothetical protein